VQAALRHDLSHYLTTRRTAEHISTVSLRVTFPGNKPSALTTAVLEHHASGFIYRSTDDTPAAEALARWATEIVPAVRDAIAK
jgi:uncharacterized membrane protein